MENPIKMDDLGVPLFLETTTYIYIYADLCDRGQWFSSPKVHNYSFVSFYYYMRKHAFFSQITGLLSSLCKLNW